MEHHEWLALPESERKELLSKIPLDEPVYKSSDAETSDDASSTQAHTWHGWSSGESQRDAAKSTKHWPDGAPIGRGHGQPYLQARWARQLRNGLKQVEGRPDEGWARHVGVDDYITFKISGSSGRVLCTRVKSVTRYSTFGGMLRAEGLSRVLPGAVADIAEGVELYHGFANRAGEPYWKLEREHGVVAITLECL